MSLFDKMKNMSWREQQDELLVPPVLPPGPSPRNERGTSPYRSALSSGARSTSPKPPSYRSSASTYNASRDGDPYANSVVPRGSDPYSRTPNGPAQSQASGGAGDKFVADRYARNNRNVGDPYARSGRNADADRNELFAGYKPENSKARGPGRFDAGGDDDGRDGFETQEQEDEDVEGIKQQTRFTKQESVNSTRNALRIAREAEETARGTLLKLGDQSEKLANTERHLDMGKAHANRAEDRTGELKQLNRSIFRPVITWNKEGKRAAEEARIQARHDDEREEREKAMGDVRESQNRIGRAATYGRDTGEEEGEEGISGRRTRARNPAQQNVRMEQRKRFQFEKTASDDELEDELDDNLDEIGDVSKRLKALAMAAGEELDGQLGRINGISDKAAHLDNKVIRNTDKLRRIK